MTRAIVSVGTTSAYQRGLNRLRAYSGNFDLEGARLVAFDHVPAGCPAHADIPYAFKAYALKEAAQYADVLLYCDSCVVPIRSMEPLWERIERDGYYISNNGWSNYEWTAESAYPDLFPYSFGPGVTQESSYSLARSINRAIPHVVAGVLGLNVKHPIGRAFLDEYYRLASETKAFCGPWVNSNYPGSGPPRPPRVAPCGPPDVRGHRHDQTAASVIAWRLEMQLVNPPEVIAYGKLDDPTDERTILLIDGSVNG